MNDTVFNRRNAIRLTAVAGVSAFLACTGTAAQASTTNTKRKSLDGVLGNFLRAPQVLQHANHKGSLASTKPKTKYRTADEHFDAILEKLLQVPQHLQYADPKTYPNFEAELDKYLGGITVLNPRDYGYDTEKVRSTKNHTSSTSVKVEQVADKTDKWEPLNRTTSKAEPVFDLLPCIAAIAGVVGQYGLPVMKVIGWIQKAKQLWKSVSGIARAIAKGNAVDEIGEDGAKVLEAILGLQDVISACFS